MLPSICTFLFLLFLLVTTHTEIIWDKEPQLRNCFHGVGLQASIWGSTWESFKTVLRSPKSKLKLKHL